MTRSYQPVSRSRLVFLSVVLAAAGLLGTLAWPILRSTGSSASERAALRSQAQPEPAPVRTPGPRPLEEREREKINEEIRVLELQQQRIKQEIDIANQAWRAPAEAIAALGPTLVGLALATLLARALTHWMLARAAQSRDTTEEEREDF
jgi:hypothetical protein